jgi:hypothetical protein
MENPLHVTDEALHVTEGALHATDDALRATEGALHVTDDALHVTEGTQNLSFESGCYCNQMFLSLSWLCF